MVRSDDGDERAKSAQTEGPVLAKFLSRGALYGCLSSRVLEGSFDRSAISNLQLLQSSSAHFLSIFHDEAHAGQNACC
ncbi:hypothetical protein AC629_37685 [Bradyrhizobium sp. NAS80.1]|nr:hypothetical protein AC629_37685 [Bradyrhizobium sp. NAS80.1]